MSEKIEMRKLVPVAAMISAGKSKLLNVLYNINFLECKAGIGTKFVNILRYNPSLTEPKFYHLRLRKEGEDYVFYKDNLSFEITGEKNIIEENKNTNHFLSDDSNFNYENIFYMTEINESPFLKDKEYLLTHDLCDIPGLSEYQEIQTKQEDNKEAKEEKEEKKTLNDETKLEEIKKQLLDENEEEKNEEKKEGNIEESTEETKGGSTDEKKEDNNEDDNEEEIKKSQNDKKEDDIYYNVKIEENTYLSEIFKIIKKYIDGAIIIMSIQNYFFDSNFELIAKLHKVIEKDISNFLIILNKTDLSTNLKEDINKCKGLFMKHFPSCKTFNINLNTFIPLSTYQLQNELLLDKSFKHLLNYHFYNYMAKLNNEKLIHNNMINKSFIDHLKDIIKTEKTITREEIEKTIKEYENPGIDDEIITIIKELRDQFKGNDITLGITENDFIIKEEENKDILDLDADLMEENTINKENNNIDDINPSYILKFLYIYQTQNKLIPTLSEETYNLLNYFKVKKNLSEPEKEKPEKFDDMNEKTKINKRIMSNLKSIAKQIKDSQFVSNEINNIINEIYQTIEFLKIYDVIFIPFLGPSNAGKTTIINGIIGEEILPADLNECTKRGIIIRYSNEDEPEINIRKAVFTEEEFMGKKKYYFEAQDIIAKGLNDVQDTVKGLNYNFTDKEEDSFYYIRTKIKLFDDLGLDNYYKKMIYLIDFPGFGTSNIFEKKLYKKIMSICNSFIFVVRNSVIKENKNKELLEDIFIQARNQKNKLSSGFIKNCLFVFNNDNSQTISEEDLNSAKQDISELIKTNIEDINAVFFNAKYYCNYIDNFNFFFKIKNTFNSEFKKFRSYKNNIFKYPELYKDKTYKNFISFIYKEITDKTKKGFTKQVGNNQEIIEKVKNELNEITEEYENNYYIKKNEFSEKIKTVIGKIMSFGQNNINELPTFKESKFEEFKKIFLKQINYVNNSMQIELKNNLNKVITTLDYFFKQDFTIREKDLKLLNEFISNLEGVIKYLRLTIDKCKNEISSIKTNYETKVIKSLECKKDNINKLLKEKDWKLIKSEIDSEMMEHLGEFNKEIKFFFEGISYNSFNLYLKGKKYFTDFTKGEIILDDFPRFEDYFLGEVSNKGGNFSEELAKEIRSSIDNTMNKIYKEKGLIETISSSIIDSNYLINIIDIIIKYYNKHTNYLFDLLNNKFYSYVRAIINQISTRKGIIFLKYTQSQSLEWKKLCTIYSTKREKICADLTNIIN